MRFRHADGRIRCVKGRYTQKCTAGRCLTRSVDRRRAKGEGAGDATLVTSFKTLIEQIDDYIYIENRNHVTLAASRTLPNLTESAARLS